MRGHCARCTSTFRYQQAASDCICVACVCAPCCRYSSLMCTWRSEGCKTRSDTAGFGIYVLPVSNGRGPRLSGTQRECRYTPKGACTLASCSASSTVRPLAPSTAATLASVAGSAIGSRAGSSAASRSASDQRRLSGPCRKDGPSAAACAWAHRHAVVLPQKINVPVKWAACRSSGLTRPSSPEHALQGGQCACSAPARPSAP